MSTMSQVMKKPTHKEFSKKEHIESFVGRKQNQKLTCSPLFTIGKTETWSVSVYEVTSTGNKYIERKIVCLVETPAGYDITEGSEG